MQRQIHSLYSIGSAIKRWRMWKPPNVSLPDNSQKLEKKSAPMKRTKNTMSSQQLMRQMKEPKRSTTKRKTMRMVTWTTLMTFNCRLPSKMILNISDTIELRLNPTAQGPLQRNLGKSGSGWPSSRLRMRRRSSETFWHFPKSRAVATRTSTSRAQERISRNQKIGKKIRTHRAH